MEQKASIVEGITVLTREFSSLVTNDHHKDRDCHWYIETRWSYGESPDYFVIHDGYVIGRIEIACDSYDLALFELKHALENAIDKIKSQDLNYDFDSDK